MKGKFTSQICIFYSKLVWKTLKSLKAKLKVQWLILILCSIKLKKISNSNSLQKMHSLRMYLMLKPLLTQIPWATMYGSSYVCMLWSNLFIFRALIHVSHRISILCGSNFCLSLTRCTWLTRHKICLVVSHKRLLPTE